METIDILGQIIYNLNRDVFTKEEIFEILNYMKNRKIENRVTCEICTHSWTAVHPMSSEKLECPNCHLETHIYDGGIRNR